VQIWVIRDHSQIGGGAAQLRRRSAKIGDVDWVGMQRQAGGSQLVVLLQ
jgi:hypothetical protein